MRTNHIRWRLSALVSSIVLLLQLIDCCRYNVVDGNQLENVDGTSLKVLLDSERVGSELEMARSSTSESDHQSSRVIVLMKRSSPTIAQANESHENDKSARGSIDGKRAEGHSRIDGPQAASLFAVEAAAKGDEYSDSDFANDLENNFPNGNKNNLLAKLKSFIESLSDKIIPSVNNLKAEQGVGQSTNNDHTTLIERRKKRLSKEIVQIIQDDINLAGASNKSEKANQKAEQSTKKSSSSNNSIKSTPTLKSMLSGEIIRAGEQTSGTPTKSTSVIWKHNLESLLKDQDLRIENSTFDLGHIKRLHQRELADTNSLTPIAQLKEKVMSFMHFG